MLTNLGFKGDFTVQRVQWSSSLPDLVIHICLVLILCTGTIKLQEKKPSLNWTESASMSFHGVALIENLLIRRGVHTPLAKHASIVNLITDDALKAEGVVNVGWPCEQQSFYTTIRVLRHH